MDYLDSQTVIFLSLKVFNDFDSVFNVYLLY